MMKSIQTAQHGRVIVTLSTEEVLRMQKKGGWQPIQTITCAIYRADNLKRVGLGVSMKSELEKGDTDEGRAKGAKLAFKRAVGWFKITTDRVALWNAWGKTHE